MAATDSAGAFWGAAGMPEDTPAQVIHQCDREAGGNARRAGRRLRRPALRGLGHPMQTGAYSTGTSTKRTVTAPSGEPPRERMW